MTRNPRAEAAARAGGADARVLEPSPPAVAESPFFADDPLDGGEVLPIQRPGARTWAELCDQDGAAELRAWCENRWLVPRSLDPLPSAFVATRRSLHALGEHVLAPCRYRATGKIGLRYTYRGLGTPFFGADRQVRVEDGALVDGDRSLELTTLRAAADFLDVTPGAPTDVYQPSTALDLDAPLDVDPLAARALGDWFGFCASLLEQLRADAHGADAAGRVQLWPEHFDMAVDIGPSGHRANFGGSPGDEAHPDPYLYIGPWENREGPFWNEPFGASLGYAAILGGADPLAFFREGRRRLTD